MNYWQLRMLTTQNKLTKKTIKETEEQLIKYYGRSMKKIIKQFEETLTYFLNNDIDIWIRNKAIQKSKESKRLTNKQKEIINSLKK